LSMIYIALKVFLSLNAQTIEITPTRSPLSSPNLVCPGLDPILDLVTLLRSVMIRAKKFTVSHQNQFNRIDFLSVKDLITLLHNVQVRQEF